MVYVIVWRWRLGRELTGGLHLTRRGAERHLRRARQADPGGDYRIERVRADTRGVFGKVCLVAAAVVLAATQAVILGAVLLQAW
jgi:hypothetical protein